MYKVIIMAKQLTITKEDLMTNAEAAEALNVCKAQINKYVKENKLRRVKDGLNKSYNYIYKPDVETILSTRFYFEGE